MSSTIVASAHVDSVVAEVMVQYGETDVPVSDLRVVIDDLFRFSSYVFRLDLLNQVIARVATRSGNKS